MAHAVFAVIAFRRQIRAGPVHPLPTQPWSRKAGQRGARASSSLSSARASPRSTIMIPPRGRHRRLASPPICEERRQSSKSHSRWPHTNRSGPRASTIRRGDEASIDEGGAHPHLKEQPAPASNLDKRPRHRSFQCYFFLYVMTTVTLFLVIDAFRSPTPPCSPPHNSLCPFVRHVITNRLSSSCLSLCSHSPQLPDGPHCLVGSSPVISSLKSSSL